MGNLDGLGGVKAPGGFRDGERKCLSMASWDTSLQQHPKLLPGRQGVLTTTQGAPACSRDHPWRTVTGSKGRGEERTKLGIRGTR